MNFFKECESRILIKGEEILASAIIVGIMIGIFMILGIVLYSGKGAYLIAGYNTKEEQEKDQYDAVALCKFMGKMVFALCFSMCFWILGDLLRKDWLFTIGVLLFIGIVVFMIAYVNTKGRFKK